MADQALANGDVRVLNTTAEGAVRHRVEIEVGEKKVKKVLDRVYKDLAKQVRIKGFRPGKAPRSVLEKMYGPSVAEEVERALVGESLGTALEQAGLEPVTEPSIDAQEPKAGAPFLYTASIEVRPEIELPDLEGLPASRPSSEVLETTVEEELESLRQRQAPLVEVEAGTAAAIGHSVTCDFVGRIEGEVFEGGTAQDVEMELGSGRFIPGFEEQIVGAEAGSDVEVNVTFPEEYGNEELAGKAATFAVHVHAIKERQVPELDDEFAKDVGVDSLDDLRDQIRKDLVNAKEQEAQAELRRTLFDSLIERASFEVPPGLVDRQLEQRLQSAQQRLGEGLDPEMVEGQMARWREEWRTPAEREVREMLLLEAVTKKEGLEVEGEEVEAKVTEMAEAQGVDADLLKKAYGEDQLTRMLRAQLLDEKALEFLSSRARVEETTDS